MSLFRTRWSFAVGALVVGILAGCQSWSAPSSELLHPAFDTSKVTCDGIEEAREDVEEGYNEVIKEVADTYVEAIRDFESEKRKCLEWNRDKWPCDDQNDALQKAYKQASENISDDNLYKDYKEAKKNRDECFEANKATNYEDWATENKRKDQECLDTFQMKHDAAERLYYEKKNTAKMQRDAALAALDELEKKCKQPASGGQTAGGNTVGQVTMWGTETTPEETTPPDTTVDPEADVCTAAAKPVVAWPAVSAPSIPWANSQVRTGKAAPLGGTDVLKELLQAIAEDVTGTPIPISAISDQIFAGIVCVKIRSRLAELEIEQSDAQLWGDRKNEIRLRKKIADYNKAMQVWCAIAEGRPPLNIKEDMQQIQDAEYGEGENDDEDDDEAQECSESGECGDAACCSETELGTWSCADGKCVASKKTCPTWYVCGWSPAACLKAVKAIEYQWKYIPVDQLHSFTGPECDEAAHWHANAWSAKATDGTTISDPGDCGYGKVAQVKVTTVFVE